MNKTWGFIAMSALLLTGCSAGGGSAASSSSPSAPSASATAAAKFVPQLAGKTPGQANNILDLAGVAYDYYQDGALVTSGSAAYPRLVISSTEPKAGEAVPDGTKVKINAIAAQPATPSAAPKPTGYAATVPAKFPGYPLIVHAATLDYRIKSAMEGKLVNDQVVALAPGLYTPYNPNVPDLASYYFHTGVYGDSAIKNAYMPEAGGSMWPGVLPGPEEPK